MARCSCGTSRPQQRKRIAEELKDNGKRASWGVPVGCAFPPPCLRRAKVCPSPAVPVGRAFPPPLLRRARACPSPCVGCERERLNPWRLGRFSFRLIDRGGQAPALRWAGGNRFSFIVGRGPVPRHAAGERKRLNPWRLGRFSFRLIDRGGQAPALRKKGSLNPRRGQAPALRKGKVCVSCRHRGGQAPALRYIQPAFFLWKIKRKSDIIKHIKSIGGTWR